MATRDWTKLLISSCTLLWLGLMIAPAIVAADELQQVDYPDIDFLFSADGSDNDYTQVFVEPVSVWYPTGHGEASAHDLRRLASGHVENALSARGLELVDAPTRGGLIVRVQYIDLTASPASANILEWAGQFRFRVEPGRITIVAEARDAATGDVLLRMADLQDEDYVEAGAGAALHFALRHWGDVIAANITWPTEDARLALVVGD